MKGLCAWEGVGDQTELQYIDPHSYGHQRCVFLAHQGCSTGGPGVHSLLDAGFLYHILSPTGLISKLNQGSRGPLLLGGGFLYHILLPTGLVVETNWLPVFIELYNSSIAHSISLEWHVWLSSSGNNCHAVHRSLSSGASVYDCIAGFYLVPYCQPSPPTRFLPITAIGMCHFLPVHHLGMACLAGSKVNIQQELMGVSFCLLANTGVSICRRAFVVFSLSLILPHCSVCHVHFSWMVCDMKGKWP